MARDFLLFGKISSAALPTIRIVADHERPEVPSGAAAELTVSPLEVDGLVGIGRQERLVAPLAACLAELGGRVRLGHLPTFEIADRCRSPSAFPARS
jgi:hypothetical protein